MTRCTCLWRTDLSVRLLPDPECPSSTHVDEPLRLPVDDREPKEACACVSWCGCGRRW